MYKQKEYLEKCKKYLIEKESIIYNKDFIETLKYQKEIISLEPIVIDHTIDRCKNCELLVKNKYNNSTIPNYYCKYKKICLNKSTKACDKFRRKN